MELYGPNHDFVLSLQRRQALIKLLELFYKVNNPARLANSPIIEFARAFVDQWEKT